LSLTPELGKRGRFAKVSTLAGMNLDWGSGHANLLKFID